MSCSTLEYGQKPTIDVFNSNNSGTILVSSSQLTNGSGYHQDDRVNSTPWGHAPRVFLVGSQRCYTALRVRSAVQPRRPPDGHPPAALSQQRQVFPGPELDDHRPLDGACLRTDDSCFLAFGNLRGRNGQSDVEKAGRGSIIPRKFLPHHVTFSKSARISHHEPTAQRLLPVVWGVTTSRGLASGGGKSRFMAALLDLIGGFTTTCRLGVGRTLFRVPGCLKRGRRWPHGTLLLLRRAPVRRVGVSCPGRGSPFLRAQPASPYPG